MANIFFTGDFCEGTVVIPLEGCEDEALKAIILDNHKKFDNGLVLEELFAKKKEKVKLYWKGEKIDSSTTPRNLKNQMGADLEGVETGDIHLKMYYYGIKGGYRRRRYRRRRRTYRRRRCN